MRTGLILVLSLLGVASAIFAQRGVAQAQGTGGNLVFSRPAAEAADGFTMIGGLRELSSGKVLVSDPMERSVQLVDLAGGTPTRVGREGQGPGEYSFPGELLPLAGDTTLLVDRVNRRFLTILPNGKTGGTIPFPQNTFSDPRGIDWAGRIYFQGSLLGGAFTPGQPTRDSTPITRWDWRRNVTDTVTWLKVPSVNISTSGGNGSSAGRAINFRAQPFSPEDAWSVSGDGRVAVARVRDYHIEWFSPALQRTTGPANRFTPVKITEADKEALRKQMANGPRMMVAEGGGGTSTRSSAPPPPSGAPSEPEYPEFKPPFPPRSVWVTPEGMVWVLRSRAASDPIPMMDVFDQRGTVVGKVTIPRDRRIVGFGRNSVYMARTDGDDLQWLERYSLGR